MKIESLEIKKLHGLYDYSVNFNSDLTFLYGSNGCGKTTILNVIESIVSGHIYDLYMWNFERIRLKYYDDVTKMRDKYTIQISYNNDSLCITFNQKNRTIKKDDYLRCCEDADSYRELFYMMGLKYEFLNEIAKEFNYVYLPLNRNTANYYEAAFRRTLRMNRRRFFYHDDDRDFLREEEIGKEAHLIQKRYAEASARVRTINDEFRNQVLKSLLGSNIKLSNEAILRSISESIDEKKLNTLMEQYIELLTSLELLDREEKEKYYQFFSSYKRQVNDLTIERDPKDIISLIYDYHEIEKIKTVIPLAQDAEEKKARAFNRINLFVETMNSFICQDETDKKSHLIPKLVYKRIRSQPNSIFRSLDNINKELQDGEKYSMLCHDCERRQTSSHSSSCLTRYSQHWGLTP